MNRRTFLYLTAAAAPAALLGAQAAQACGPEPAFTKPLKFEPGKNVVAVRQTIKGDVTHEWIVAGKPGQRFEAKIEAKSARLTVYPDKGGAKEPMWDESPKGGSQVKAFSGIMPKGGRVMIEIATAARSEVYTLGVMLDGATS